MFKIYDGREYFYQWDIDRKLIVEDPSITEVHFCNRTDDCSLVCETYVEDGVTVVDVPNILLQTDWKIRVYAYDGTCTKHDEYYEVKSRTKPADYVYTETEVLDYKNFEADLERLKENPIPTISETILDATNPLLESGIYRIFSVGLSTMKNQLVLVSTNITTSKQIRINHTDNTVYERHTEGSLENLKWSDWITTTGKEVAALGDFAFAFGNGTVAGQMGYYMTAINFNTYEIALSNSAEKVMPVVADDVEAYLDNKFFTNLKVGDTVSIINGAHYHFCATITNKKNNLISLSKLPFSSIDEAGAADVDDNVIFVPAKPKVGAASITIGGFATGLNSKAAGKGAFAAGRDNVAAGDSAFVGGRRNKAGYIATASGLDNNATGNFSFAANNANTASGERSVAFGCATKASGTDAVSINNNTVAAGAHSFATGWNTEADGVAMTVGGKFNKTKDNVIVAYGNGDNTDTLRDAYTLDWDGNGKYHGHVNSRLVKEDYFDNGKVYSTVHGIRNFDEFIEPGFYNFVWYHKNDGGLEEITPWKITVSVDRQNGKTTKIYQTREAFGSNSGKKYWLDIRVGDVDANGKITWGAWEFIIEGTRKD